MGGAGGVATMGLHETCLYKFTLFFFFLSLLLFAQFLGLPEVIVYQLYVHTEVDCDQLDTLCQRSYYRLSKTTSALMLDQIQQAEK